MQTVHGLLVAASLIQPAHDVYSTLRSPHNIPCCSSQDCEPVDYYVHPSGEIFMVSRKYGAVIRVPLEYVIWSHVEGSPEQAHWCGTRRTYVLGTLVPFLAPGEDPRFVTYCAFIDPGGS